MALLGRKPQGHDAGLGAMSAGTARASIMGRLTSAGWVTAVGARVGKPSGGATPTVALGLYQASAGAITTQVVNVVGKAANAVMEDRTGGADVVWPLTAVKVAAGQDYALALLVTGAAGRYGQDNSGHPMHFRTGSTLPTPYGAASVSAQGRMSLWAEVQPNRAPTAPVVVSPVDRSDVSTTTPAIRIRHQDPDTAVGDRMSAWRIEVWNAGNTARIPNRDSGKTTATSPQRLSGEATWTPAALSTGATYTLRVTTWDDHGVAGAVRTSTVTVTAGGRVEEARVGAPVGRRGDVDVVNTGQPAVTFRWWHESGLTLEAVQLRIRTLANIAEEAAGGPVLETRPTAAVSFLPAVASGTTTTSASTFGGGGWATLPEQREPYVYQLRGEISGGGLTPWATSAPFLVNGTPQPLHNSPAANAAGSVRPDLLSSLQDITSHPRDTVMTHEVRPAGGGTIIAEPVPLYVAADSIFPQYGDVGVWRAPATTAQMPGYGTYEWRPVATDAFGLIGVGAWRQVRYLAPITLSGLTPASGATITTGTPTIAGTADRTLSQYRVSVRVAGTLAPVWDSGVVTTASASISRTVSARRLRNATDYEQVIWMRGADGLETTVVTPFRLQYPAPAAMTGVTIAAVPSSIFDAAQPEWSEHRPNVAMTWNRVSEATVPDADWLGYVLRRDTPDDDREWRIRDRNQTSFVDTSPDSGVLATFSVAYARRTNDGFDEVECTPVTANIAVQIRHTVLTSDHPDDPAVTLHFWQGRSVDPVDDTVIVPLMGAAKPAVFRGPLHYDVIAGDFRVLSDRTGQGLYSARDIIERCRELARPVIDDDGGRVPRVLTYRDSRRTVRVVPSGPPRETDHHDDDRGQLGWSFTEVDQ